MPDVSGHELESVVDGGRGDLKAPLSREARGAPMTAGLNTFSLHVGPAGVRTDGKKLYRADFNILR